ncbi:MAG: endonuclease, partial [Candidatus Cloacimonetes bacterium]|nr:endonuclease [Candidatus Cloacimonadota bacterium]
MQKPMRTSIRFILITALMMLAVVTLSATMVVNENIQNWDAHTSYGSWVQAIPAGDINMTSCLVSPGSAASGTGSAGRIQCQASSAIIEFPEFNSIGEVEFNISAGSTGRSIKLQKYENGSWIDVVTFSGIIATGTRFFYRIGQNFPTRIRLANPSHAVYVHDMFITDFVDSATAVLTLAEASQITYGSALLNATIESTGASFIGTRGLCWSTNAMPDTLDAHITLGNGISPISATIVGLLADTDYYVRAYALNSAGLAFSNQQTFRTISVGQPTTQTTQLEFYPGNTSVQVSWTPGNGSRRILKINTGNSFTVPTDGVEYTPNSIYSGAGEQVVYCGATQIVEGEPVNAITVTGLNRNTSYWFRAYEMNGSDQSSVYLGDTAIGNPSSTTTLNTGLTGYYDSISGYGAELKASLHNLLQTSHLNQFSYSAVWQQLQYTDEDSLNTNNVIETYTGWSVPKNFYGSGVTQWNREHTWSSSHGGFDTNRPAGTDLHHIRPCDVTVNSAKGNKDFDNGGNPYVDASPYTGYDATTGCFADPDSWEPRPVEKGDVARMLFYMAVRYEGTDTGYNLEMLDSTPTAGSYYGKLSTLLQWHYDDPPDSWERRRNDRIQERQGNRNPFIDHPEYITSMWVPQAQNGILLSEGHFAANWLHAVNAINYQIDVSADSLFSTFIYQNQDTGYVSTTNIEVPDEDVVYYRVRAFFGSGYSPYSTFVRVNLTIPPLELSSFTVTLTEDNEAMIQWITQYETNLIGYKIYRNTMNQLNTSMLISPLIPATNTSLEQHYSFTDTDIPVDYSGSLYY